MSSQMALAITRWRWIDRLHAAAHSVSSLPSQCESRLPDLPPAALTLLASFSLSSSLSPTRNLSVCATSMSISPPSVSSESRAFQPNIRTLLAETSLEQQSHPPAVLVLAALNASKQKLKNDHHHKRARVSTAADGNDSSRGNNSHAIPTMDGEGSRSDTSNDEAAVEPLNDLFAWASAVDVPSSPPTKAVILHALRKEETSLEVQHKALLDKWRMHIAHPSLLTVACEAAKQRWITSKYEHEQRRLRDQLLQQQLYLASMQVAVTHSPLMQPHNSISIFEAIHDEIHLRATESADERAEKLVLRSDLGLKLAPSLLDKFTNVLVDRATPLLPFTTSTMSADFEYTYLATISISKIECATVASVFDAVMQYFDSLDKELGQHYNASHEVKPIQSFGPMCHYSQLRYSTDSPFHSVSNTVFAATLTEDQGLVVIDFVDSDEVFAEVRRESRSNDGHSSWQKRDITVLLSITSIVDPETQRECVLVRHLRVHRFNLLPSSPILLNEVKITQAYNNGDLFIAVVCRHLKETNTGAAVASSLS